MRFTSIAIIVLCMCLPLRMVEAEESEVPTQSQEKKVWKAYMLSWGATALPLAIASVGGGLAGEDSSGEAAFGVVSIVGLTLGPSAGHWYAGEIWTTGLLMRSASVASALSLAVYDPHLEHVATVAGLVGAVALWETGVVWDIVTLPRALRRHKRRSGYLLTPMLPSSGPPAGLVLSGTY